ncbi:MAG TPA: ABC-type transport auxiliary lipoprotein family protein, partial [Candidatus Dormibacteraeota bacterium]|nr:ABC-type transport auxiliary lipoprotein family protein [Candidatus Dormibacteraeota bacterium]
MTKKILTSSACIAVLLIAGCAGKVRYPKFYTLEIPAVLKPAANSARVAGAVSVRRFETPAYLRQGRIVYREAPEAVDFYEYHRWAAEPGPTVTAGVIDSIRSAGLFSFVKSYDGQDKPEYLMTG